MVIGSIFHLHFKSWRIFCVESPHTTTVAWSCTWSACCTVGFSVETSYNWIISRIFLLIFQRGRGVCLQAIPIHIILCKGNAGDGDCLQSPSPYIFVQRQCWRWGCLKKQPSKFESFLAFYTYVCMCVFFFFFNLSDKVMMRWCKSGNFQVLFLTVFPIRHDQNLFWKMDHLATGDIFSKLHTCLLTFWMSGFFCSMWSELVIPC